MELEQTKQFLLVKSVEEADPGGAVIPMDERGFPEPPATDRPDTEADTSTDADTDTQTDPVSSTAAKTDAKTKPAGKSAGKSKAGRKAGSKASARAKLEVEAKAEAEAKERADAEAEAKAKAEAEAKAKARAEAESEADADDVDKRLAARSEQLFAGLAERHPTPVQLAMSSTSSHLWIKVAVVIAAFLIGLATKQLGPERRVNVLAFPILGLLAWNLIIYLVTLLGGLIMRRSAPGGAALGAVVDRIAKRAIHRMEAGSDQVLAAGLSRFVALWYELTAKARVASAQCALHLGAAALSLGVIAGMYWNGFAFQYLAAWESTFLSPAGVQALFANLFAPASAISTIPIPGIEQIRAMQLENGDEGVPAADWIHLFAITVGLFVLLPRLLLAWTAKRRAAKLEAGIDPHAVAGDYIDKLLKTREGGNLMARIVPHRMELGSKERDRLRAFAHQLWGGQLWVEFDDPIAYGDEEEATFEQADYQMLVLNLSATPEDESQGRLVKRFRNQLDGDGLVLLEGAPFRERFGGLGEFERRLDERLSAWQAVLGRAGVDFALYDGDADAARLAAGEARLKPRSTADT